MSIAEINEEIDRIRRVRPLLRDLGDVAEADRRLAYLVAQRAELGGARPLPATVIARCAGTDPLIYHAHGATAAGDNRRETEEDA